MAIVYATLYVCLPCTPLPDFQLTLLPQMLFAAFPIVFQQERGWSPGVGGLAFIGVLVGFIIALAYIIFIENPRYARNLEVCRFPLLWSNYGGSDG